jgi:hypothetical protein
MEVDAYSDDSYDYYRAIPTNYEETLTQYPTNNTTLVDSSTTNQLTHVNDQSTLILESFTQVNEPDNYTLLYPTPPSSTPVEYLDDKPKLNYESPTIQDANDIYYSTTHWPSNCFTLPSTKLYQVPSTGGMAYKQQDISPKVNCPNNYNSHNENIDDMKIPQQPILHMPKPMYPTIFKPTFNSDQNGPDLVPSNIDMKFDYTTPPPNIGYATCRFKPSALDNRGILCNIDSLDASSFNHNDELVRYLYQY